MATVYRALDRRLGRTVALKVLHPELTHLLGADRFRREISIAAALQHDNIVSLYEAGDDGGLLYYTMPLVEGETLRARLEREGQLRVDEAVRIAEDIAAALGCAHLHGVIHRDIKPENILLKGDRAMVTDFGIARAITEAGEDRLTSAGLAIGTPAYMSPEQGSYGAKLDGRADIYALGCVLYEMLSGEPPFTGPSAQAIVARQMQEAPRSLRVVRPSVSPALQDVVEKALAKVPADRYPTAEAMVGALEQAKRRPGVVGSLMRSLRHHRGVAIGAVALVSAVAVAGHLLSRGPVDAGLHVVLPFAWRSGAVAAGLTGGQLESLLHDAIAHWGDVRLVGEILAHDAWARGRDTVPTFRKALDVARNLGAGKLAWGEAWLVGDSVITVHAGLYDVAKGGRMVEEADVSIPRVVSSVADVGARFIELAGRLLLPPEGVGRREREAVGPAMGTTSLAAFRALLAGRDAFDHWEIARAESLWREAVRMDPEYAEAQLWLAQTASWAGRPASEWHAYARGAVSFADRLTNGGDSALALGMLALSEGRSQEACEHFRAALRRDTLNVAAWFGLGECLRNDSVVVRDRGSPYGWRFRSSYEGAVTAYQRALELAPSFNNALGPAAYDRLSQILIAERNIIRLGHVQAPDTARFLAWPALDHDTLVFVPYPETGMRRLPRPPTYPLAVSRGRSLLKEVARQWVTAFPASARAHRAWAQALEREGLLGEDRSGQPSALAEAREALSIEPDPAERPHIVLEQVRLLLKLENFSAARQLADSALAAGDTSPGSAYGLATMAALVGRARRAAALFARTASDTLFLIPDALKPEVRLPILEASQRLVVYASLGAPVESLTATETELDQLLQRWIARPEDRASLRHAVEDYPGMLAFPTLGLRADFRPWPGWFLSDAEWALSRGDTAAARATLAAARSDQAWFTAGDVLPSLVYNEAFVMLALHDTAAAESFLDLLLENLSAAPTAITADPSESGLLVRAMALRARLAARRGLRALAHRWASAVVTLWSGSDLPELRSLADSLRAL